MRLGRFPRPSHQVLKKEEESDKWDRQGQLKREGLVYAKDRGRGEFRGLRGTVVNEV